MNEDGKVVENKLGGMCALKQKRQEVEELEKEEDNRKRIKK